MKKIVVLFNLETGMYLTPSNAIKVTRNYKNAFGFNTEKAAVAYLQSNLEKVKESGYLDWCTRTFYSIEK